MTIADQPPGATPLDHEDLVGLIPSGITTREALDQVEAKNIVRAQVWAVNQKWTTSKLLTSSMMRRTHREMFGQVWKWAGKFRTRETTIGIAPEQVGIQTEQLIGNLRFQSLESVSQIETKEIVASFHHQLVKIHLFPNGNGRHARFVSDLLSQCLEINAPHWSARDLINNEQSRKRYLLALRHADMTGSVTPLVEFMWE